MNRRTLKQLARRSLRPVVVAVRPTRTDLDPGLWGLRIDAAGRLCIGERTLESLTAEFGSPLHVDDADRLERTVRSVSATLPGGRVYATHRLVDAAATLDTLATAGAGVTVSSGDELAAARGGGVDVDRLVMVEPSPTDASLRLAMATGTRAIVASHPAVAERIVMAAGDAENDVAVGVEVDLDDPRRGEAVARSFAETDRPNTRVEVVRVDGSDVVRTSADLDRIVVDVVAAVDRIVARTPTRPREAIVSIDVACPTVAPIPVVEGRLNRFVGSDLVPPDPSSAVTLTDVAERLVDALSTRLGDVDLSLEPGPGLMASSQFLLTTVLDVQAGADVTHAVLDAGINIADATTTEYHQLFNASFMRGDATRSYRFVGPICTPADVLYTNWRLPRAEIGDVLAIMDTGAGFVNTSTMFSFPRPAIVRSQDGAVRSVRRRETFDDLIALDVGGPTAD